MNKLFLSVSNLPAHTDIFLDGKYFKPKKVKSQNPVIEYETLNSTVELTIKRYSHLNTRLWVLQEIIFFLISIFGIFDMRYGKFFYKANLKVVFDVSAETTAKIKFNAPLSNRPVINCTSENKVSQLENVFEIDNNLKKKHKILKIIKWLIVVVAIVVATLIIVL